MSCIQYQLDCQATLDNYNDTHAENDTRAENDPQTDEKQTAWNVAIKTLFFVYFFIDTIRNLTILHPMERDLLTPGLPRSSRMSQMRPGISVFEFLDAATLSARSMIDEYVNLCYFWSYPKNSTSWSGDSGS